MSDVYSLLHFYSLYLFCCNNGWKKRFWSRNWFKLFFQSLICHTSDVPDIAWCCQSICLEEDQNVDILYPLTASGVVNSIECMASTFHYIMFIFDFVIKEQNIGAIHWMLLASYDAVYAYILSTVFWNICFDNIRKC